MRDLYCTDRLAESSSLACVTAVSLLPPVRRAYVQRLVGFELSHHPEFTIAMTLGSKLLLREVQCRRGIALLSMRPRVRAIHCCILVREDTMTASGPQNTKLLGGKLCEAMAACYENPSSASAATANGADGNGVRLQSAAAVSSTPVQGSTVLMAHRGSDAPLLSEKLAVHVSVNSPDLVAVSQRSGPSETGGTQHNHRFQAAQFLWPEPMRCRQPSQPPADRSGVRRSAEAAEMTWIVWSRSALPATC